LFGLRGFVLGTPSQPFPHFGQDHPGVDHRIRLGVGPDEPGRPVGQLHGGGRPFRLRGEHPGANLDIAALRRGAEPEKGGYLWRGQLRLWDNEILIGWYAADDGSVRSKGSHYLVIHPHGLEFHGRWTGLSFDGPIQSGWSAFARTEDAAARLLDDLAAPEESHD
jgi:hypothetical protein